MRCSIGTIGTVGTIGTIERRLGPDGVKEISWSVIPLSFGAPRHASASWWK